MSAAGQKFGYTLKADGLPARVALALLMSAGIVYASTGPVIVTGLALSEMFSSESAGYVLSVNMYGTAVGGLLIALLVKRVNWRITAAILLTGLGVVDCLSAWFGVNETLYPLRFLHGLIGGALMGVTTSVVARTENPERTFAIAIFVQLGLGGVGAATLTPLLDAYGVGIVWLSFIVLTLPSLFMLPLLDSYPVMEDYAEQGTSRQRAPLRYVVLALLAIFIFQAGEFSLFAYQLELGMHYGFGTEFVSLVLASALWAGGSTAVIVAWWGTRIGRLLPMCAGVFGMTVCSGLLLIPVLGIYMVAAVGFSACFSIAIPYLLGIGSEMDNTGQIAAVGSFINTLGLATGPAIAASLLNGDHYERVVLFACVVLLASVIVGVPAARMLDQRSLRSRVVWE
jgi:MFS family permease